MTGINKRKHKAELCNKTEKKKVHGERVVVLGRPLRGRYVSVTWTKGVITASHRTIGGNILFGCVTAVFVN